MRCNKSEEKLTACLRAFSCSFRTTALVPRIEKTAMAIAVIFTFVAMVSQIVVGFRNRNPCVKNASNSAWWDSAP
ncbi:MAG: hypothetical protein IJY80_03980 [Opitutales bacterium]|nr:hypothetical protein [Opitutales bacterium]